MPGAPNRPPEVAAPAAPAVSPVPEAPELKLLRRLVPLHVALLQESWKGGVPPEVATPFEKADAAFRAADLGAAASALDQLSIRIAEPRWPSLAEPFRRLRVPIPAPVPPHWDPDHGVPAPEKEARQARRRAEEQLLLVEACLAWATAHGIHTEGLTAAAASAKAALVDPGVPPAFYSAVDTLWRELNARLPAIPHAGRSAAPPPAEGAG
jgi:hypothetical protein